MYYSFVKAFDLLFHELGLGHWHWVLKTAAVASIFVVPLLLIYLCIVWIESENEVPQKKPVKPKDE